MGGGGAVVVDGVGGGDGYLEDGALGERVLVWRVGYGVFRVVLLETRNCLWVEMNGFMNWDDMKGVDVHFHQPCC